MHIIFALVAVTCMISAGACFRDGELIFGCFNVGLAAMNFLFGLRAIAIEAVRELKR